jgi:hypothetical protein
VGVLIEVEEVVDGESLLVVAKSRCGFGVWRTWSRWSKLQGTALGEKGRSRAVVHPPSGHWMFSTLLQTLAIVSIICRKLAL